MKGFQNIKKIIFPHECIEEAYTFMRQAGREKLEVVSLFAGYEENNVFSINATIFPKQKSFQTDHGLLYSVDADELHRINMFLYENNISVIAQMHSHPFEAYHSELDDTSPMVATTGGLSIVIPRFAEDAISIDGWAVYRLSSQNIWKELMDSEKRSLFEIENLDRS